MHELEFSRANANDEGRTTRAATKADKLCFRMHKGLESAKVLPTICATTTLNCFTPPKFHYLHCLRSFFYHVSLVLIIIQSHRDVVLYPKTRRKIEKKRRETQLAFPSPLFFIFSIH